jgi:hypothetical protein
MATAAKKAPAPRKASTALSEKSVNEIRSLHSRADTGWTPKSLARIFSTTEAAITAVLNRTGPYKDDNA